MSDNENDKIVDQDNIDNNDDDNQTKIDDNQTDNNNDDQSKNDDDNQVDDDDSSATDDDVIVDEELAPESFKWVIEDFPQMQKDCLEKNDHKRLSEIYEIGGAKWRMMLFPNGNDGDGNPTKKHLSFYLEAADHADPELPKGWKRECKFWLTIVNQKDHEKNVRKEEFPTFHGGLTDWGFPTLIELEELTNPDNGFLLDGKLILAAELIVKRIWVEKPRSWWSSRKETGFVGLRNQGATCYLNSLMQGLYHIGAFRRAVHKIPTDNDDLTKSVPLALQRLFFRLSTSEDACSTKELTRSFGWSAYESFKQHDVQELNRVLMDNLETKMKKTPAEGSIEKLFRGQVENFIDCVNVDYQSKRSEFFYDLSLVVKGCSDIYESFEKYTETELLDGDNQYRAEGHGLQDAKRGVRFNYLPPVLNIQLKRWEMDYQRFQPYKVNDLYKFDPILDLSHYLDRSKTKESGIYHLHAVLVHSGSTGGGHYYAYVKPTTKPDWFKFNDSSVSSASEAEAINDNWGGEEVRHWKNYGKVWSYSHQRTANAYMLIYVRETEAYTYMNDDATDVIQSHLKKANEEHLYTKIRITTEQSLFDHDQEKFDLIKRNKVEGTSIKKTSTIEEYKKEAAKLYNIPVEKQRWWIWVKRDNDTIRPDRSLSLKDEREQIRFLDAYNKEAKLLMVHAAEDFEIEKNDKDEPRPKTIKVHNPSEDKIEQSVQIFFKFFDPFQGEDGIMRYVGTSMFNRDSTTDDLVPAIRKHIENIKDDKVKEVNITPDQDISLFEEITPSRIDPVEAGLTLGEGAELQCGDIIIFMRTLTDDEKQKTRFPTPKEWFRHIKYRRIVRLREHSKPKDKDAEIRITLTKRMTFDQTVKAIGAKIDADPKKIRITGHDIHSNEPRYTAFGTDLGLEEMLKYYGKLSDILYFEILPVNLEELESMTTLKVEFLDRKSGLHPYEIMVHEDGKISDIFTSLLEQTDIEKTVLADKELTFGTKKFVFSEQYSNKIYKTFKDDDEISDSNIASHNDYLIQEWSPEELKELDSEKDALVRFAHFEESGYGNIKLFGVPFVMKVYSDQTTADLIKRLRSRFESVSDEEWGEWDFWAINFSQKKHHFKNETEFPTQAVTFDDYAQFGMEHKNKEPKEKKNNNTTSRYTSRYGGGGAIKIHN